MTLILLDSWLFTSNELKMVDFKGDYKRHFNEKVRPLHISTFTQ